MKRRPLKAAVLEINFRNQVVCMDCVQRPRIRAMCVAEDIQGQNCGSGNGVSLAVSGGVNKQSVSEILLLKEPMIAMISAVILLEILDMFARAGTAGQGWRMARERFSLAL
ncbi:MAG: hypothetical protein EOQ80_29425 [Mesorhizobium sp.]|uniref:hypothetical protein n=1 Tax=Mesorhizobium sp. TaxID=1871066 RepID=UPI000FE6B904|nr:hypothetical protein [Mesorhizobium sp.]RWH39471.1 MAG: hypothetical protein EOQ80_29425 [Mesorhizobium sp.]